MKYTIIIILTISTWTTCVGQELATIRDTVNHFEIGVPVGWRYGVPVDKSVTFMALRQKQNDQDVPRENFNLNILHRDEVDLNKSYGQFLESVGKAEGFKITDQGEKIIKNRKYKYLIETHKNKVSKEDMSNYVLFTNNDGEILILTMVTTSENFKKFKSLFDSIALSLSY
jgi:hypothetical protein